MTPSTTNYAYDWPEDAEALHQRFGTMPTASHKSRRTGRKKTARSRRVAKAIGRIRGGIKNRRLKRVT